MALKFSLFAVCLLWSIMVASSSVELPIEPYASGLLEPVNPDLPLASASIPQLRTIVEQSEATSLQMKAIDKLIAAGDEPTIARLVFALRRGNTHAEYILLKNASVVMIPYLLEDVAHGSLQHYSDDSDTPPIGQVRVAATQIASAAIASIPGLPAETTAWANEFAFRSVLPYFYLPAKSKILLEWWNHNGEAVFDGRAGDAVWLPTERMPDSRIFDAYMAATASKPPPPPPVSPIPAQPESFSALPLQVEEPFKDWAARVVDPAQRNVRWASVDYEAGKSVPPELLATADFKPPEIAAGKNGSPNGISQISPQINTSEDTEGSSSRTLSALVSLAAITILWLILREFIKR